MDFKPNMELLDEHRNWLKKFDDQHGKDWENLLRQDIEAATCEAAARRLLEENGNLAAPNKQLDGKKKSPDFCCIQFDKKFLVEVTCVSIDKAIKETALPHPPSKDLSYQGFSGLNNAIFEEAKQKTPQCAGQNCPVLLVVGTFHFMASYLGLRSIHIEELLTGETAISCNLDSNTGTPLGEEYMSTELYSATFLTPKIKNSVTHARNPISAILACGFGCEPICARLALHPQPAHKFNRSFLSKLECCRLKDGYESGKFVTEWI